MPPEFSLDRFFETKVDGDRMMRTKSCAQMLMMLKTGVFGDRWKDGWKPRHKGNWGKEETAIVSMLIRLSGELPNHRKNVDFITGGVRTYIGQKLAEEKRPVDLRSKDLHHEHMVPGSQSILLITNSGDEIESTLAEINYRALVTKCDEKTLNNKHLKTLVPNVKEVRGWVSEPDHIPVRFYGLFRYDVAGLLEGLWPVSERAGNLLRAYRKFRSSHVGSGGLALAASS